MPTLKFTVTDLENIQLLRYSVETNAALALSSAFNGLQYKHPKALPYYFVAVDLDACGVKIQLNKFNGRYGSTPQCVECDTINIFNDKNKKEIQGAMYDGKLDISPEWYDATYVKIKTLRDIAMAHNVVIIADSLPEAEANAYLKDNVLFGDENSGNIPAGYDTKWCNSKEIKGVIHGYFPYMEGYTGLVVAAENKMVWIAVPQKESLLLKDSLIRGAEINVLVNQDNFFHIASIKPNKKSRLKPV